ncbi:MAG TPA: TraB/GumN family protein [Flavitalea sp.]|nr:TraB/GumN family protein [Flavitalea sp.]
MRTRKLLLFVLSLSTASWVAAQARKTESGEKTGSVIQAKTDKPAAANPKTAAPAAKSGAAKPASAGAGATARPGSAAAKKQPAGKAEDPSHTLLWEISGGELTQPSYIFGTMHLVCADEARLSGALKKAIKESDQIFFEIDMDDMEQVMGGMKYVRMNDGLKLSDLLTPVEMDRIKAYFDEHRAMIPFVMMNRFKPYFISSMISEGMLECTTKKAMEQLIAEESKLYNKDIQGLETIKFQASLFDSIPYEKQARDLLTYIDSIDGYRKTTLEMYEVYRRQDLNRMDSLITKSDPGMEQYMDLLLYDRNTRWVAEMPFHMQRMPTLFAVGAGHLPGEKGVLNLLARQGYTVRPLPNRN